MTQVSVITTVYNGSPYFNRAIPSILEQTYSDFEYVIVDDGSTDGTAEKLQQLAQQDSRVRVFFPGRLGRASALNYAVEQAQGDYIANQDFDDVSYSQRLQQQVSFLEANPCIGLLGGAYVRVDDNRQERYVRTPASEHSEIIQTMAKCIPFAHTITTFRKVAWQDVKGYPLADNLIDLRFWLKLAHAGWQLASINEVVGEHWVHDSSFWHRHFNYRQRQQDLAQVQWQTILSLKLPLWYLVYPIGRYSYAYLPTGLKRFTRRTLSGIQETDVAQVSD